MKGCTIGFAAVCLAAQVVHAQENFSGFDLDTLSAQSGVETAHRTEGGSIITTWTRNGVTIERDQNGSNVSVVGNDKSGKGAVVCNWMIEVGMRAALEACPSEQFAELKQDLNDNIAAIDAFIVANSLSAISRDTLVARENAAYAHSRTMIEGKPAESARLCTTGDMGQMITFMNRMSHDRRRQAVNDLLSIPRWPVTNPCL